MSDLDVNKLSGIDSELIREWKDEADKKGNNDSKFLNSAFEIEYVKYKAGEYIKEKVSKGEAIEEDVKSLFGADITSTSVNIPQPANKSEKRDAKASQKHIVTELIPAQSAIFQELSNKTGIPDFNIFIYNLRANLFNPQSLKNLGDDKEYYSRLIGEVEVVANAMNKHNNYNSRDDIMKLYDQVKKELQLDKNDDFKDFKLTVLEQFVTIAENHQKNKETALLNQRYHQLRNGMSQDEALTELLKDTDVGVKYTGLLEKHSGNKDAAIEELLGDETIKNKYTALTTPLNREDAVKNIKKDPQFKGSYYQDYKGQSIHEQINNQQGNWHDGLIEKELIKGTVQTEADNAWNDAINEQRIKKVSHVTKQEDTEVPADMTKAEMTTSRRVEKGAEQTIIQKEGKIDKYIRKAQKGHMTLDERLKFERSNEKGLRKTVAIENNVYLNKQKAFTKDDFYSELKNDALFKALCGIGVPENKLKDHPPLLSLNETKDENGNQTYNLTNLANIIALHIGGEGVANRQTGELKPYSEVKNTIVTIAANLGVSNISDHDIKNLIRLCGFEVEGKNWVRIFYNAVAGTAVDSLAGLASALGVSAASTAVASVTGNAVAKINSMQVTGYHGGPITGEFDYSKAFLEQLTGDQIVDFNLEFVFDGFGNLQWTNKNEVYSDLPDNWGADNFDASVNGNVLSMHINTSNVTEHVIMRIIEEKLTKVFESLDELGIDWNKFDIDYDLSVDMSDVKAKIDNIDQKTKIANAMMYSTLISFALNLIQEALKEHNGDIPKTVTYFDETNIEDYCAELDVMLKDNPKLAQGLKALAGVYIEKDENGKDIVETDANGNKHYKWNKEGYTKFLNSLVAGNRSFANRHETNTTISRIEEIKKEMSRMRITKQPADVQGLEFDGGKAEPISVKPLELDVSDLEPLKVQSDSELEVSKRKIDSNELKPIPFSRWNDLVDGYSCLKKPDFSNVKMKSGASLSNRIAKVMQAISAQEDDDVKVVYNVRTIADFAQEADKIGTKNKAKLEELANSEKYKALKIDVDLYSAIVGSEIGMTKGVLAPPLYDPMDEVDGDDGICSYNRTQKAAPLGQDELGGQGPGVQVQKRVVGGKVEYYQRSKGADDTSWTKSDEKTFEKWKKNAVEYTGE